MHEFKVGDIVRHKSNGREFTLSDLNDRALTPEYSDEYWADGWSEWGSEEVDRPEDIELVMSAEKAAARKLPTSDEIAGGLNLLGDGWGGKVDVNETEKDGATVFCYGTTDDGLRVTFRVTVTHVYESDNF